MNMKMLLTTSILAGALQFAPIASSQETNDAAKAGHHPRTRLANLSATEREKFRSAHQKAMQDPAARAAQIKVREARREFRQALHAAMLKADSTIQPILDKMPRGGKDGD
jgi:hypothetical protein